MPRVIRAIDLRDPPPQFELANGLRVQIRYFDAPGWMLFEEWAEQPNDPTRFKAVIEAAVEGVAFEEMDRSAMMEDYLNIITLAKGWTPQVLDALKNVPSGDVGTVGTSPPTPPSSPTTTSPISSVASPAPTAGRSAKSGTSPGTKRSSPSTR